MPVRLGEEFEREDLAPPPAPVLRYDEQRHLELLAELAAMRSEFVDALRNLPAPVVRVEAPEIVEAVTPPPVDADAVGAAVARHLPPVPDPQAALEALADEVKRLGKKVTAAALGGGGGGGIPAAVVANNGRSISTTEPESDTRYEWQSVAGTSVPLYQGTAAPGTQAVANTWHIEKYTYITGPAGDAVPSVIQTAFGAWDSRASLF